MSTRSASPRRRWAATVKEILVVVAGALVISALLRALVFEPFTIPSGSMENTLQVNDKVVAQKLTDFHRGDVIVFRDPADWVSGHQAPRGNPVTKGLEIIGVLPNSSEDFLTKRVIGTPGDRVKCCDAQNRVTVNDAPLAESAYLYADDNGPIEASSTPFDVVVPADSLFVMGDHRNASADSRCHMDEPGQPATGDRAFVPVDHVVGTVGLIVAPFERWQQLRTPTTFANIPPPGPAPDKAVIHVRPHC